MTTPSAERFDTWYANMAESPTRDDVAMRTLGLPPELESSSLLPWTGIADVSEALALTPGDTVVDLACGRGGYGLEIAKRTAANLIGVDFSAVAIERARRRAGSSAEFRVGDLTATGLPDGVAAAVLCVDAMQFADPFAEGIAECRRILARGGRLVLTGWQAVELDDETVPERLRRDIAAAFRDAGFVDVSAVHMPAWRGAETAHWQAAAELDPAGDPALESMRDEGTRVLPWLDRTLRMMASGRVPFAS
jgi:SAM-dependent methyltransferase